MSKKTTIYPHIILSNFSKVSKYTPRPGRGASVTFNDKLIRQTHGSFLQKQLTSVTEEQSKELISENAEEICYSITFDGFAGIDVATNSLASGGIQLLNIQKIQDVSGEFFQRITVSIPKSALASFENKINAYLDENKDRSNKPANQKLIQSIQTLKSTSLWDLWNDDINFYPTNEKEKYWFEIWLLKSNLNYFVKLADALDIQVQKKYLHFPERTVLLINCTLEQLSENLEFQNYIVTFRKSKTTAIFFNDLSPEEQTEWSSELLSRYKYNEDTNQFVCLLDTGVNHQHPLLKPLMNSSDQMSIDSINISADEYGHGTAMAGIVAYGDLTSSLESSELYTLNYGLESVKILEKDADNYDKNYGYLTSDAVSISEIEQPNRKRFFVMPITTDEPEHGRPTAWSSSIDALCADSLYEHNRNTRLFFLAAGNITHRVDWKFSYPDCNESQEVFNPGQAWNAITVGAITYKTRIKESADYSVVAKAGELSPQSSTSSSELWDSDMPLKPEVVFEGGNLGEDGHGKWELDSLSLLTTNYQFTERQFTTLSATSAATALAANFAAQIVNKYPNIWYETIRGLMIHSAEWNTALRRQFGSQFLKKDESLKNSNRKEFAKTLRERVGFGQPNLRKALESVENSAHMIMEEEFQPYYKEDNKILSNMLLVELPWPRGELEQNSNIDVRLTVTLSYFIEPNPSGQAAGKYTYPSHQLKFDLNRPLESKENFLRRIDDAIRKSALNEEIPIQTPSEDKWLFGINQRSRGSIHKDIWEGNAIDLAQRNCLVIYPTTGWWKTREKLKKYNSKTKLSLIISLETIDPNLEINLYSMIKSQIQLMTQVEIDIESQVVTVI